MGGYDSLKYAVAMGGNLLSLIISEDEILTLRNTYILSAE